MPLTDSVFMNSDSPQRQATGDLYPSGTELTIAAGATLTVAGTLNLTGTLAHTGTQTFDDIDANDSSLGITGLAATAATGGAIVITGGATTTSGVGGLVSLTGGAGSGTSAGGAASVVGGASGAGATGNGGAVAITGGAAASTNGNGGAVAIAGGAKAGSGTEGAISIGTAATSPIGFYGVTPAARPSNWTITNKGATKTFSGSEGTAAVIAAALALLIDDLQEYGLCGGTAS